MSSKLTAIPNEGTNNPKRKRRPLVDRRTTVRDHDKMNAAMLEMLRLADKTGVPLAKVWDRILMTRKQVREVNLGAAKIKKHPRRRRK